MKACSLLIPQHILSPVSWTSKTLHPSPGSDWQMLEPTVAHHWNSFTPMESKGAGFDGMGWGGGAVGRRGGALIQSHP